MKNEHGYDIVVTHPNNPYSITRGGSDKSNCYPAKDTYQFQEFAGPVFEMGGYSDMSLIDPYTGDRFWVGNVFREGRSILDAMRLTIDIAEASGFFRDREEEA